MRESSFISSRACSFEGLHIRGSAVRSTTTHLHITRT